MCRKSAIRALAAAILIAGMALGGVPRPAAAAVTAVDRPNSLRVAQFMSDADELGNQVLALENEIEPCSASLLEVKQRLARLQAQYARLRQAYYNDKSNLMHGYAQTPRLFPEFDVGDETPDQQAWWTNADQAVNAPAALLRTAAQALAKAESVDCTQHATVTPPPPPPPTPPVAAVPDVLAGLTRPVLDPITLPTLPSHFCSEAERQAFLDAIEKLKAKINAEDRALLAYRQEVDQRFLDIRPGQPGGDRLVINGQKVPYTAAGQAKLKAEIDWAMGESSRLTQLYIQLVQLESDASEYTDKVPTIDCTQSPGTATPPPPPPPTATGPQTPPPGTATEGTQTSEPESDDDFPPHWYILAEQAGLPEDLDFRDYDCTEDFLDDLKPYLEYLRGTLPADDPKLKAAEELYTAVKERDGVSTLTGFQSIEIIGEAYTGGSAVETYRPIFEDYHAESSFGSAYVVGGFLGAKVLRGLYIGPDLSYTGGMSTTFSGDDERVTGTAQSTTFLLDTRFFPDEAFPALTRYTSLPRFGSVPSGELFLDFGLGASVNSLSALAGSSDGTPTGVGPGGTHTDFAWQLGAGLRFNLWHEGWLDLPHAPGLDAVSLDLRYFYRDLGDFKSASTFTPYGGDTFSRPPIESGASSHNFVVGLSFHY